MMENIIIRPVTTKDIVTICEIYNYYILHTTVTFEEEPVTLAEMEQRISAVTEKFPWLVYVAEGQVLGYAYATAWRARRSYRFSAESTIYLSPENAGKGIGIQLYTALLAELKEMGIHAVMGGIAQPNAASVALHEKLGFAKVAHFREVGFKFEQWVDVGYWEYIF